MGIHSHDPGFQITLGRYIKIHNLPGGMYTCVRAAGAGHLYWLISHNGQSLFQLPLHRAGTVILHLPATEAAAIIFNTQGNTHAFRYSSTNRNGIEIDAVVFTFLNSRGLAGFGNQLIRFFLLFVITFLFDFLQNTDGAFIITHINIGSGQIQLGTDFIHIFR